MYVNKYLQTVSLLLQTELTVDIVLSQPGGEAFIDTVTITAVSYFRMQMLLIIINLLMLKPLL